MLTLFGKPHSRGGFCDGVNRRDFLTIGSLGVGGFGHVVTARNLLDGQKYAVKHVRFDYYNSTTCLEVGLCVLDTSQILLVSHRYCARCARCRSCIIHTLCVITQRGWKWSCWQHQLAVSMTTKPPAIRMAMMRAYST